jgi:hypothetical protein
MSGASDSRQDAEAAKADAKTFLGFTIANFDRTRADSRTSSLIQFLRRPIVVCLGALGVLAAI